MKEFIYQLVVKDFEEKELAEKLGKYANDYECIVSSIFYQLDQSPNIQFDLQEAKVIITNDYLKSYCEKVFNYKGVSYCELLFALMKADLLVMGVRN